MSRFPWIAGLALLSAGHALAQAPLPLELEWHAPAECASSNAVRAELARIATARTGLALRPLVARIEVSHRGNAYVAQLRTEHEGRSGQRQLEAANCRTLVRSVTLVLALAFGAGVEVDASPDPKTDNTPGSAATRPSSESPNPDPPQPDSSNADSTHADVSSSGTKARSNTSGAEASANARGSKPSERDASDADSSGAESSEADTISPEHARLNLWLSAGVQFALLPSAAFTAGLGLELEARRYSIGLRALLWPSVTKKLSTADGDVQAHFAAFGAAFRGCALFPLDSLTFATCAALQAAAVRGDTDSTARVRADSAIAPWYSLAIAAGLDWPRAAPLRLRLEASLSVSLDRPRFDVEGSSSAYRVPQWSPLLAAGLVFTP